MTVLDDKPPTGMRSASQSAKERWNGIRPSDVPMDLTFGGNAATAVIENARLEGIHFEPPPEGESMSHMAQVTMLFGGVNQGAEITLRPPYLHLLYGLLSSYTLWKVEGKPDGERPEHVEPTQYISVQDATIFTIGSSEKPKEARRHSFSPLPATPPVPEPPSDKVVLQMRSFKNEIVLTFATTLAEARHLLLAVGEALVEMRFEPEETPLFPKDEEVPLLRKRFGALTEKGFFKGVPVRLLSGPLAGKIATIDSEIAPGFFGVKIDGASMAFPVAAFERLPDFGVGEAVTVKAGALSGQHGIVLRQVEGKQGVFFVEIEGDDDLKIEIAGEKLSCRATP